MWQYNYSDELYHWGVKNMKWGVRRYQNEDGTLTEAGKKRYGRDTSGMSNKKKKEYQADANKWVKEDLERSKRLTDASNKMVNDISNIRNKNERNRPKVREDLSSMTDKEMRDRINRELLERQYNDMFNQQKVSRGSEFASKALDKAGDILLVTSTALSIALAIKELRG